MKLIGILLLAAFTAVAQEKPVTLSKALKTEVSRLIREHKLEAHQPAPNEVKSGRVTLSGVLVQLTRTKHPWQLVNPAAPAGYGDAEQNVARDPTAGRASGLKLFAINF